MTHRLSGGLGELRGVVTVTRKATGKVEQYQITGTVSDEATHNELMKSSLPAAADNQAATAAATSKE